LPAIRKNRPARKSWATPDRRLLLLSVFVQLALAPFFGHPYDSRLFLGTGYLVATGHTPYAALNLMPVFHHLYFNIETTIGYPPPWPLLLGLMYRCSYAIVPNLLVYNLAIKLPVIAANVGLAYLVAAILKRCGARPAVCRTAWVALLFNPMLLYFGAVWGQIDVIVALLALGALLLLHSGRRSASAVLLALAVCFKPIAAPLLLVALVCLVGTAWRQALRYAATFVVAVYAFYVLPFYVFDWSTTLVHQLWNTQFAMSGRMSLMTVFGRGRDPFLAPGERWYLGLAWIPAVCAAAGFALRRSRGRRRTEGEIAGADGGERGALEDLMRMSAALVLVFLLTRTWLSEDNIVLLLPFVLVLTALGRLPKRAWLAVWTIPLVFSLLSFSPLELLFPAFPGAMVKSLVAANHVTDVARVGRMIVVIAWQIVGWWLVVMCLRRSPVAVGGGEP
jgi:hypothetical protein